MQIFTAPNLQTLAERVGQELAVSDWFPVAQERVNQFAEVTEDRQWIHLDAERAQRETPFGGTIAHGYLTLSLLPHLADSCMKVQGTRMGINYGLNRVRFMTPVPVGGRIRARFTLQAFEPLDGGAQLVWQATIELEGSDKPACVAEMVVRRYV